MKKIILSILCVVMLSSCGVSITPALISKSNDVCEKNGGLRLVWMFPTMEMFSVYCNNGAKFDLDKNVINKSLTTPKE